MPFLASSISSSKESTMGPLLLCGATATAGLLSYMSMKKKINLNKISHNEDELHATVQVSLPEWTKKELPSHLAKIYETDEEMMALAVHLSSRNAREGTGGPFGCAIYERNTNDNTAKLVSVGVNRVVALGNSTLHGETVAIQLAQSKLKSFTMQLCVEGDSEKKRQFELFTSCEPCAMCLGATLWSGVSRIVCGATKSDAEAIGFDEGPVFEESYEHLRKSGIDVKKSVLQVEAAKVLEEYGRVGVIYN
jgi:tRNA(Arg) A34 adenosine deaminase TadA